MKLYIGTFHYFATCEGHHVIIASFLCEDHQDPKWIFYQKYCREWDHQDRGEEPSFDRLKSSWEYFGHGVNTYLIEESEETSEELIVTTHDLPEELMAELSQHLGEDHADMIKRLAQYGLQKFVYILHYNLS